MVRQAQLSPGEPDLFLKNHDLQFPKKQNYQWMGKLDTDVVLFRMAPRIQRGTTRKLQINRYLAYSFKGKKHTHTSYCYMSQLVFNQYAAVLSKSCNSLGTDIRSDTGLQIDIIQCEILVTAFQVWTCSSILTDRSCLHKLSCNPLSTGTLTEVTDVKSCLSRPELQFTWYRHQIQGSKLIYHGLSEILVIAFQMCICSSIITDRSCL